MMFMLKVGLIIYLLITRLDYPLEIHWLSSHGIPGFPTGSFRNWFWNITYPAW